MKAPPSPGDRGLVLIRHGKSAWDDPTQPDHARGLAPRGRRDGPRMGEVLGKLGWGPDQVRSSDAVRAWQTWEGLAAGLRRLPQHQHGLPEAVLDDQLFHAKAEATAAALNGWLPERGVLWVIGHNPGWEDLIERLCGERETLPTCAAALLVPAKVPGKWRLIDVLRPKELQARGLAPAPEPGPAAG